MTNKQKANLAWAQSQNAFNPNSRAPSVVAAQTASLASKSVEEPVVNLTGQKRTSKPNPKYQRKNRRANRKSRKQSRRANRKTRRH